MGRGWHVPGQSWHVPGQPWHVPGRAWHVPGQARACQKKLVLAGEKVYHFLPGGKRSVLLFRGGLSLALTPPGQPDPAKRPMSRPGTGAAPERGTLRPGHRGHHRRPPPATLRRLFRRPPKMTLETWEISWDAWIGGSRMRRGYGRRVSSPSPPSQNQCDPIERCLGGGDSM